MLPVNRLTGQVDSHLRIAQGRTNNGRYRRPPTFAGPIWPTAASLRLEFDELWLCVPACRSSRCVQRQELAASGLPRGSPQAALGCQNHRAEGLLSSAPAYSHWRPRATGPGGCLHFAWHRRRAPPCVAARHQAAAPQDLAAAAGAVRTTCPFFTASVGPGLNEVRATPSLPARR